MSNSSRLRLSALATAGFAATTFVGSVATPTPVVDAAARLEALSGQVLQGNITYLARMLSLVLLTPAIVGALRLLPRRGGVAGVIGAALLLIGLASGAAVTTIVAVQINVLAPAADRRTAVTVTGWLDDSSLWLVGGVFYLLGWILGFAALGIALWRGAAVPRWAAVCIGIGPVLHIAGGDLPLTVIGGAAVLTAGLLRVALATFRAAGDGIGPDPAPPTTLDPAHLIVSADSDQSGGRRPFLP